MRSCLIVQPEDGPFVGDVEGPVVVEPGALRLGGCGSGRFVAGVRDAPFAFSRLLLTWNARLPEGTALGVSVRVGDDRGAWSPWFELGRRGDVGSLEPMALPAPDEARTDEGLAVQAVDVVECQRPACRYQYGLHLTSPSEGRIPRVGRVAVSVVGEGEDDDSVETSLAAMARLKVPWRSQFREDRAISGKICQPTCLAMVAEFYGTSLPTAEWAARCLDPRYGIYGNWAYAVAAAGEAGFGGWARLGCTVADLLAWVAEGTPVIMSVRYDRGRLRGAPLSSTKGHLILLVGWEGPDRLLFNDPAGRTEEAGAGVAYLRSDVEAAWNGGLAIRIDSVTVGSRGRSSAG